MLWLVCVFGSPLKGDLEAGEERGEKTVRGKLSTVDSSAFLIVTSAVRSPSSIGCRGVPLPLPVDNVDGWDVVPVEFHNKHNTHKHLVFTLCKLQPILLQLIESLRNSFFFFWLIKVHIKIPKVCTRSAMSKNFLKRSNHRHVGIHYPKVSIWPSTIESWIVVFCPSLPDLGDFKMGGGEAPTAAAFLTRLTGVCFGEDILLSIKKENTMMQMTVLLIWISVTSLA